MSTQDYIEQFERVYHVTLARLVDRIRIEGLQPKTIETCRNGVAKTTDQVCLSIPTARNKWVEQMRQRYPDQELAILSIDSRIVARLKCDLDYSSDETSVRISQLKSEDFEAVVNASGDFACLQAIPQEAISVDEVI